MNELNNAYEELVKYLKEVLNNKYDGFDFDVDVVKKLVERVDIEKLTLENKRLNEDNKANSKS